QRGYKAFPSMDAGKIGTAVVTNNVADAILAEDPYDIKVIFGVWCNFAFSGTQAQRWEDALKKVPFFCHVTTNASEMTHYADLVLPAAHHSTEKWSASNSMANLYSFMSIQQPVVNRFWDVKADENEIMWALAEKLKAKGFSNLYDFYSTEFKDPDTSTSPTTEEEFAIYSTKFRTKPSYDTIGGWEKFKELGIINSAQYTYRKTWDNMGTVTKKFEFYSQTLKKSLEEHATKYTTTVDDILTTCNYTAQGDLAFVPHYEPPMRKGSKEEYPFEFIDYKSKLNREGRSANIPWYYEFHKVDTGDVSWDDVLKMNPKDAQRLNLTDGEKVRITSVVGSIEATLKTWEGVREGTVAKAYGQGHKKYGKVASLDFAKGTPRGGNNNYIIPAEYERLSGSNSRNGGFFGVKIEKATTGIFGSDEKVSRNINVSDIFPNPAKDYATIGITLQTDAHVKITVYNIAGRNVLNVNNGSMSQGSHTLRIDLSQLENGIYICQVQSGTYRTALKLIVEK
ncbi:T9SS C-terminal target domain-containing protein, partial [Bacteroidetes/Chlorobi group bacterium ChocPot_Mid]